MEKLNEKKLRATGSFLAKNKYKILGIQNQGDKESDFLRKCLEDAIEDYLKEAKVKIKWLINFYLPIVTWLDSTS